MSHEENRWILAEIFDLWNDAVLPVRGNTFAHHLERFTERHLLVLGLAQVSVQLVEARMTSVFVVDEWRRVVVGLAPLLNLVFAVLFSSLGLAQALKGTVVALVDTP